MLELLQARLENQLLRDWLPASKKHKHLRRFCRALSLVKLWTCSNNWLTQETLRRSTKQPRLSPKTIWKWNSSLNLKLQLLRLILRLTTSFHQFKPQSPWFPTQHSVPLRLLCQHSKSKHLRLPLLLSSLLQQPKWPTFQNKIWSNFFWTSLPSQTWKCDSFLLYLD